MKIEYIKGNLLSHGDCVENFVVHGCNAQGVMGAGIAYKIKELWPAAYVAYREKYEKSGLVLGDIILARVAPKRFVLNAITQQSTGVGPQVDYDAIRKVMSDISDFAKDWPGFSGEAKPIKPLRVAMPTIGAGLGGGDWNRIAAIIEECSVHFQPVVYVINDVPLTPPCEYILDGVLVTVPAPKAEGE
jgi:O-acetyl-ADP-ribose deacetylase (regulator of RNase III)